MMRTGQNGSTFRVFLISILSLSLVVSFGLHTVQVEHTHPGEHRHDAEHAEGSFEIEEYFHGIEQKSLLLLLIVIFLGACMVNRFVERITPAVENTTIYQEERPRRKLSIVCYLIELFRKGILNPKCF